MSNLARKIEKNKYKNMPIVMTQEELDNKLKTVEENYKKQYSEKLHRMSDEMHKEIRAATASVVDTISVELLYELANQMNAFDKDLDNDIRDQIIDKVQDIYTNTMDQIKQYSKYKRPAREFKKRKNVIEKYFNIKF